MKHNKQAKSGISNTEKKLEILWIYAKGKDRWKQLEKREGKDNPT